LKVGIWVLNKQIDVKKISDECALTGTFDGKPVEGFVVRSCVKSTGATHFFKIKFDEPYLMFREWREVTNRVVMDGNVLNKFKYKLTPRYVLGPRKI
jgi:tRNA ligase